MNTTRPFPCDVTDGNLQHLPHNNPFCTIPSKCSATRLVFSPPSISSHPQHPFHSEASHPIPNSSSFQVTQQHPLLPSESKLYLHIILSSPPINVLYMGDPFLLILKIRKKDVFLRSLRIICPSYRKVRIRKIKCSNTKRNGKRLLTSSVLVNSQLYPH